MNRLQIRWYEKVKESLDAAQVGGIDLTAGRMNIETKGSGPGVQFNISPAQFQQWQDSPGVTPVIINIEPMTDLSQFLGIAQK